MEEQNLADILTPESDYIEETSPDVFDLMGESSPEIKVASPEETPEIQGEADTPAEREDLIATIESLGGQAVIEAIQPLAELMNSSADSSKVIETLTNIVAPEHLEELSWRVIESNADTILADPEVQSRIAQAFGCNDIEEVVRAVETYRAEMDDPESAELRQFKSQQRDQQFQAQRAEAEQRGLEWSVDFFEKSAEETLESLGVEDTDHEIKLLAQASFLHKNRDEYMKAQALAERGLVSQAKIAAARLQNKWQATLINAVKKYERSLPKRSKPEEAPKSKPAATKPKSKPSSEYELGSHDWLTAFTNEFRSERQSRGL